MRTATTILVLIFLSIPVLAEGYGPQLIIEGPTNGAVLPGNEQRSIVARFEPPVDFDALGLDATIEAIGPGGTFELARGDLRSRDAPDRVSTIWSLDSVAPGDYRLRVTARAGRIEDSAEVSVTVQPPPLVDLYLTALRADQGGVEATFDAVATSPAGTPVVEYVFDTGDGSDLQVAPEPRFVVRYPALGADYTVSVRATDATGASSYVAYDLHLPYDWYAEVLYTVVDHPLGPLVPEEGYGYAEVPQEKLLKKPADCGCKRMTITGGGRVARSRVLCAPEVEPGRPDNFTLGFLLALRCTAVENPPADACPAKTVAFDCPLGQRVPSIRLPRSTRLSWGFEVSSELMPKATKQSQCMHGQFLRADMKLNGFPVKNLRAMASPQVAENGKVRFPRDNGDALEIDAVKPPALVPRRQVAKFGADDFASQDLLVRRLPTSIYWYDQPFIGVIPAALGPRFSSDSVSAANDLEFISFVRGVNGQPTCWCRFTLVQNYTVGGGVEKANAITIVDGNRCFAGPGVKKRRLF